VSQKEREAQLARLAAAQYGVFSREQARSTGMSESSIERRVRSKLWVPVYEGIYSLPAAGPSWDQALMATLLWAGPGALVSHRAAAALWELDGVEAGVVEATIDRPRHSPSADVILHRSGKLPACDKARVGAFTVTSVSRTLIDLSSVLEEEILEQALDAALRRRLASIPRLRWRLGELAGPGRYGAASLRKLLDARPAAPSDSVLETRVIRLLRSSKLPLPVSQYAVREGRRVLLRVDLAYPDQLVAIECDGYRYHSGRKAWQGDLKRRNLLATRGWRVLHVTWEDLMLRPKDIVEQVRKLLS
jgi:very-short-patch-repair endonuclease